MVKNNEQFPTNNSGNTDVTQPNCSTASADPSSGVVAYKPGAQQVTGETSPMLTQT